MLVGVLVGFAFLAKMLQAFLVVPAFALVYLLAAPPRCGAGSSQLLVAGAALLVSAGWWVAIVELWPASSRPYIGGSQTNSVLELIFGYNGLGRLSGNETGSVVGGGGRAGGMWGATGLSRLFDTEMGGQIVLAAPGRAARCLGVPPVDGPPRPAHRRTRARRSALGGWLVVTGPRLQLSAGDHAPVLHGGARPGDRRRWWASAAGWRGGTGAAIGVAARPRRRR